MNQTDATFPKYSVVMTMNGVGPSLGSQIMAEIGNITCFTYGEALTAFAGVTPSKNDSGNGTRKVCILQRNAFLACSKHCCKSWAA